MADWNPAMQAYFDGLSSRISATSRMADQAALADRFVDVLAADGLPVATRHRLLILGVLGERTA